MNDKDFFLFHYNNLMLMGSGSFIYKNGSLEGFFSFLVWYLNKYLNNSQMFKYPPNIQRLFYKNGKLYLKKNIP